MVQEKINDDLKKPKFKSNYRSLARLIALQVLYQDNFLITNDQNDINNLHQIKQDLIENFIIDEQFQEVDLTDKIDRGFIDKLIELVKFNGENFDQLIAKNLRDHNLNQLESLKLQIFRLAICELKFMPEIPTNAIINEYVDLAGSFLVKNQVNFINGLLVNLVKEIRPN
jgi:N utilization substance protein B